ncbi:transglutaminaseTgpA domain-containing protein [Dactylosporangium sp. NPDC049742]|uniref:transglutaminase TgpA family protein n=1 Tax=Dactylosporangium sp. NPDC049742 TaxID=3154737 RepID=UPI00343B1CC2
MRLATAGLLGSTAAAGLLFTPVFGPRALVPPILVVVVAAYGCVELAAYRPRLASWRPLLVLGTGLLGLVESVLFPTTAAGLPTTATLRALQRGATDGWLLTLQSTWPARPDPELLLFVPLAVLLAAALGIELLLRLRLPVAALLPGLAVAGLAQAYQALTGATALLVAVCYAAPAALLLWADRPNRPVMRLSRVDIPLAATTVLAIVAGTVALGSLDPAGRTPYSLKNNHSVPLQYRLSNPLQEIAQRLSDPDREVFRYHSDRSADRWSLVVLDGFDGVNWSIDARLYRLGSHLPAASAGMVRSADVRVGDLSGPWLPSQPTPLTVDGLAPLVNPAAGTLLLTKTVGGDRRYRLTWSEPAVNATTLGDGTLDTTAGGLGRPAAVPAELERLAKEAVPGARPTFQSALQLEKYLSEHYQVVRTGNAPTGNGWPQLQRFLTESMRGTSEQFAAAYVALARLNGIPARLVVGFRGAEVAGDTFIVRNRDVLAWPEVPVAGVGWVPLDPTAAVSDTAKPGKAPAPIDAAVEQARAQVDATPSDAPAPPPQQPSGGRSGGSGAARAGLVVAAVLGGFLVLWLFGVPLAVAVRSARRRRRTGTAAVAGAWAEARDRLRAHGVPYGIGMTPRDFAGVTGHVVGEPSVEAVARLGRLLDTTVWSGRPVTDETVRLAWDEVQTVRRGLAGRPWQARLRAAVDPRVLRAVSR